MDDGRERRLNEIRREAEALGRVDAAGARPAGSPMPPAIPESTDGYYGLPLLKAPVWTWEIPAYFFVGGAAGAAAVVGAVARLSGADARLVRDARWIAAVGAAASPALLVSDLGRPERFLNMLRVFKIRSPMSVGAWTLVAFSQAAGATAFADVVKRVNGRVPVRIVADAAEVVSAATGLVLSTYTGVLIGATAVPVWSRNVSLLPIHFGASGLGAAVSMLELMGHRERALNMLGIGAAAADTAIGLVLEGQQDPSLDPLKQGWPGKVMRLGGVLSGPVPLSLRVLAGRSNAARRTAAVSTIIGSLLTRVGWLAAGKVSANESPRHAADSPTAPSVSGPRRDV